MIRVRRSGITLIEVVVVLAIIGFLFALFVPAVEVVRKQADRMRGQNNLRQLALAMHNYADSFAKLPPIAGPGGAGMHGSLFFQLLPFIEQDNVYRRGDVWKAGTIGFAARPLASSSNTRLIPDPFGPPTGSGTAASAGSVVGSPSRVTATPGGSSFPAALSWAIRPSAITAVAMSSSTVSCRPAGTATDSGLVATAAPRAPA